jgi:hypothetical protein
MPGLLDDVGKNLGGLFGNLGTGAQNFLQSSSPASAIGNLIRGVATGQATDEIGAGQQLQQQVFQTLLDNGVPRERALLAIQSPEALKAEIGKLNPTYTMHNIGNTVGSTTPFSPNFTPQFTAPEFKTAEPGAQVYSYQPPLPGQAPMRAPIQASPLGSPPGGAGPMPLPPGGGPGPMPPAPGGGIQASPMAPPAGAAGPMQLPGTQVLSPGMSPQTLAAQRSAGTAQGQAAATLPNTLAAADQALKLIDQVQNHPGKNDATGFVLGRLPFGLNPQAQNFITTASQLQGQVFLRAYGQLKGAGAISEVEGQKGEQAIAALNRAQTTDQFDRALNDLRDVVTLGRTNAIKIAGGDTMETPAAPAQQTQAKPTGSPIKVNSPAEARKLPKGQLIELPDGSIGRVP